MVGRSAMRLMGAHVARMGAGGQRHGRTSITHELAEADVLLEAWYSHFACEYRDLEVSLLVAV
jgi:hypothetical protein